MAHPLMKENVWYERNKFQEAETKYQEQVASKHSGLVVQGVGLSVGVGVDNPEILARLSAVEKENADLKKITTDLQAAVAKLTERLSALDTSSTSAASKPATAKPVQNGKAKADDDDDEDDDDDDFDLFGDDDDDEEEEESEEKKKRTQERVAAYQAKKSKKPALIAKSNIILDVKPWDDETDMAEIEKAVRTVAMDGLLWGASKLVPLAYGIKKLQITCVVVDDKVGTEDLEDAITAFEDLVQSVDIAAFNKV
ncbi:elongation factor 1-delta-like isoform X2 [Strongylocentrotus purpuratus]|uniref:Translation elongation factor EF1B beta/delta subunit guanine nucleotide exchange domain-containing protein n=1 Tax=Strongylocentrotus purpuratus TaxID=7668 RepID=A0A7M7HN64_STRPU|nr:elongation factor 1-delta-like isoform X2 [Strongylocentrotus purpuratus]|eukprot:XP_011683338.1 PREDICTED: elongation factor 1-delta-like isoform X2 [Strongylocentrotus purpuratus]